ncbi:MULTISPECIES: transglutaminase family protein [unclassified Frondihabitans]|uniref:transglutaminase-like domain-containing protein n=1 Tax=unclassified Frondihabitans TaxID=2626248 RepID=UPI000F4FC2F3|nr:MULTISPECIES: transglutaminase family protein [unclassified Frondihabitans]RPE74491.1 transglutaminase-like putative cysteine protease [Frondihabitans sp. PhB153]RPF02920.1 transglutaminase-like putative cysteine protease [Frondihabitans sp. PhB161]
MQRNAFSRMVLSSTEPAELVLSVAAAEGQRITETLSVTQGGREVPIREVIDDRGTRLHVAHMAPGRLEMDYRVEVTGQQDPIALGALDSIQYLRPSRYCESDTLFPTARSEFAGLSGLDLLDSVGSWVNGHLSYVPGSSAPTDGAVRTFLDRRGVCRDYAHLVVALLRALDVPARLVSVYAPGLYPMDFHAVAEALIDGRWYVIDATHLAPRQSLVRIATGRDASDTAFLSSSGGWVKLLELEVGAVADVLPRDDVAEFVSIG